MLNKEDLASATDQKYTEFSDKIKQELESKLKAHPEMIDYNKNISAARDLKAKFAEINNVEPDKESDKEI